MLGETGLHTQLLQLDPSGHWIAGAIAHKIRNRTVILSDPTRIPTRRMYSGILQNSTDTELENESTVERKRGLMEWTKYSDNLL